MGILVMLLLSGCSKDEPPVSLRVGIPHSDNVQNLATNYYLNWLEEETGIDIVPVEIRQTRCDEFLEALKNSDTEIDIVLFGNDFVPSDEYLDSFINEGYAYRLFDGSYVYENYGATKSSGCGQVMWINSDWLQALSLEMPRTTDELVDVLRAFKTGDPNGNGKADEIPLIGSTESYYLNPLYFLMNAYVYADPYHSMYYRAGTGEIFTPETVAFKEGTEYIRGLYEEKLLDGRAFSYSPGQLFEIINNSENLVGAFTSDSIGSVIYQGNPEVMAKYICLLPIEGPNGARNALYVDREPVTGAIIMNGTGKEGQCEKLLDKMMTPDGSLIARFGEQGVDWDYSDGLDVSLYGETAKITTINYIWNSPQNKHLNGIGPMKVPDEYLAGVTWNGFNSDMEYIDARAEMNYMPYFPARISEARYDETMVKLFEQMWIKVIKGDLEYDAKMFSKDTLYSSGH